MFLFKKSEKPENEFEVNLKNRSGLWDPTTLLAKRDLDLLPIVKFIFLVISCNN
jgi:hypothetical protein